MSRHAFWTIIIADSPTAFRAPTREDLEPTLVQLRRTQPDAAIRWFERGRLWESPGQAQDAAMAKHTTNRPRRGASWRPGGEHKDPRDKYKVPRDVKRKRWAAQAAEGRGPWVDAKKPGGRAPAGEAGSRRAPGAHKGGRMAGRQQDGSRSGERTASAKPRTGTGGKTDRLLERRSAVVGGRRPRPGDVPIPGRTPNVKGTERAEEPPRPPKHHLPKGPQGGDGAPARRRKRDDD